MEQERLEYFKKLLDKERQEVLTAATETIKELNAAEENLPDITDMASAEADRSFQLRIRDRERKLLNKIDKAILRISDGTYGICEGCGDDIEEKRLEARPVTTLCIKCKAKQETEEKAKGL